MGPNFIQDQTSIRRSTREILVLSILPLLKLICIGLMGLIFAHPRIKLVPRPTFGLLSKLVFALFLPCMIFTHLGEIITLTNMMSWWFMLVNVIVSTVVGCVLGLLVVKICRPPQEYVKFTIAMTGLGNTGNLPIAIVESVCRSVDDNPFGLGCRRAGFGYVSFAQWFSLILVYTFGYYMMGPPLEDQGVERDIEHQKPVESNDPVVEEAGQLGNEEIREPFIVRVLANSMIQCRNSESCSGSRLVMCLVKAEMGKRIRSACYRIFQPTTLATLLAFIVGMVPHMKSFVYGDDAPLPFIAESLELLAGAVVPSVMLILGGMLAECPKESRLGVRTTIGIIVCRLLVLPLFGVGIVCVAGRLKFLIPGDKMYRLVALLQYTTPSAIVLGGIASLRGCGVREASVVLFWQHVFGVLSLAIYMVIYFKMLVSYE